MTLETRVKAALATHPDDKDLKLLAAGWSEARQRYASGRNSANRREWKSLQDDLVKVLDALEAESAALSALKPPAEQDGPICHEAAGWPNPLPNRRQAAQFLKAMGFRSVQGKAVPERTIYRYIERGVLGPDFGSGDQFSQRTLMEFGKRKLESIPGTPSERYIPGDRAVRKAMQPVIGVGDADKKAAAHARLMEAQAALKELEVKQARAELVDILLVDREQADLCQAIRMHMSPMVRSTADQVLALVGGDLSAAREIIALVGGDLDKVDDLSAWIFSRRPEVVAMYKPFLRRALDTFVRGQWLTTELAEEWRRYQVHREDTELAIMAQLIRETGGNPSLARDAMEKYYVRGLD
jgi:hypothetical protein